MARQKYFIGRRTKTLDCPCGYIINSSTDRECDLKIRLHSRNCDIASNANQVETPPIFPHIAITPYNVAIHKNHEKVRNQKINK